MSSMDTPPTTPDATDHSDGCPCGTAAQHLEQHRVRFGYVPLFPFGMDDLFVPDDVAFAFTSLDRAAHIVSAVSTWRERFGIPATD